MVQAILTDRKTITRRIVKPQIKPCEHDLYVEADWKNEPTEWVLKDGYAYCGFCGNGVTPKHDYRGIKMKWQDGDVLWVRETSANWQTDTGYEIPGKYYYKADDAMIDGKWKPSIFMPKDACRLFLEVESVRIERLHEITEEDAILEGIKKYDNGTFGLDAPGQCMGLTATIAFMRLWQYINGEENWNSNPWVWRIEYKKIERPESFLSNKQPNVQELARQQAML